MSIENGTEKPPTLQEDAHINVMAQRPAVGPHVVFQVLDQTDLAPLVNEECPICYSLYEAREEVALIYCHHTFHSICIAEWLLQANSATPECPVCKSAIDPDKIDARHLIEVLERAQAHPEIRAPIVANPSRELNAGQVWRNFSRGHQPGSKQRIMDVLAIEGLVNRLLLPS